MKKLTHSHEFTHGILRSTIIANIADGLTLSTARVGVPTQFYVSVL